MLEYNLKNEKKNNLENCQIELCVNKLQTEGMINYEIKVIAFLEQKVLEDRTVVERYGGLIHGTRIC